MTVKVQELTLSSVKINKADGTGAVDLALYSPITLTDAEVSISMLCMMCALRFPVNDACRLILLALLETADSTAVRKFTYDELGAVLGRKGISVERTVGILRSAGLVSTSRCAGSTVAFSCEPFVQWAKDTLRAAGTVAEQESQQQDVEKPVEAPTHAPAAPTPSQPQQAHLAAVSSPAATINGGTTTQTTTLVTPTATVITTVTTVLHDAYGIIPVIQDPVQQTHTPVQEAYEPTPKAPRKPRTRRTTRVVTSAPEAQDAPVEAPTTVSVAAEPAATVTPVVSSTQSATLTPAAPVVADPRYSEDVIPDDEHAEYDGVKIVSVYSHYSTAGKPYGVRLIRDGFGNVIGRQPINYLEACDVLCAGEITDENPDDYEVDSKAILDECNLRHEANARKVEYYDIKMRRRNAAPFVLADDEFDATDEIADSFSLSMDDRTEDDDDDPLAGLSSGCDGSYIENEQFQRVDCNPDI